MPQLQLRGVVTDFRRNTKSVQELIEFDRFVMDFAIAQVETLHRHLTHRFSNPADTGEHTLMALKNVRQNDSLRRHYQPLFNQGIVLLVSYFGAAVADIFRIAIPMAVQGGKPPQLLRERLHLTVKDLVKLHAEPHSLGQLIENKKDVSFQDMQSIVRAFKDYVGVDLERDEHMNNVILAQACHHVFAHARGVADAHLMRQLAHVTPRAIKLALLEGQALQFTPEEVATVSRSMVIFVDSLACDVEKAIAEP